jgi:hypothetical protein
MNFSRLAYAISVYIDPCTELSKGPVIGIDLPVAVAAIHRLIQLGQRPVTDFRRTAGRERSRIAEELAPVVDDSISVPVPAQEGIVSTGLCPGDLILNPICVDVEMDARVRSREMKAVLVQIEKHRTVFFRNFRVGRRLVRFRTNRTNTPDPVEIVSIHMGYQPRLIAMSNNSRNGGLFAHVTSFRNESLLVDLCIGSEIRYTMSSDELTEQSLIGSEIHEDRSDRGSHGRPPKQRRRGESAQADVGHNLRDGLRFQKLKR